MKVLEQTEATAPLAEYTAGIDQEPVIITSNGKPIAALLPIENADLETVSLSTNPKFLELIERSRVRHRTEGGMYPFSPPLDSRLTFMVSIEIWNPRR